MLKHPDVRKVQLHRLVAAIIAGIKISVSQIELSVKRHTCDPRYQDQRNQEDDSLL